MEKENKRKIIIDLDELTNGVIKMTNAIRGATDPIAEMAITDAFENEFTKMSDQEVTKFLATSLVLAEITTELPGFDVYMKNLKNR